ncbi:hypothetical protein-transmembrane prediction [Rhodopirellula baltica SH 1]|uniref:Uncharacterized protein n=1 Tax=Rhodopirellula baltica (strain DSM 10527 / NCIMB 13988 / SH1) TaxID=243090 RepID=Q7UXV3_RHOBA|nr:hypothetical protein-transmembrane prediction [Rhodopirellula baltica SH 1]
MPRSFRRGHAASYERLELAPPLPMEKPNQRSHPFAGAPRRMPRTAPPRHGPPSRFRIRPANDPSRWRDRPHRRRPAKLESIPSQSASSRCFFARVRLGFRIAGLLGFGFPSRFFRCFFGNWQNGFIRRSGRGRIVFELRNQHQSNRGGLFGNSFGVSQEQQVARLSTAGKRHVQHRTAEVGYANHVTGIRRVMSDFVDRVGPKLTSRENPLFGKRFFRLVVLNPSPGIGHFEFASFVTPCHPNGNRLTSRRFEFGIVRNRCPRFGSECEQSRVNFFTFRERGNDGFVFLGPDRASEHFQGTFSHRHVAIDVNSFGFGIDPQIGKFGDLLGPGRRCVFVGHRSHLTVPLLQLGLDGSVVVGVWIVRRGNTQRSFIGRLGSLLGFRRVLLCTNSG